MNRDWMEKLIWVKLIVIIIEKYVNKHRFVRIQQLNITKVQLIRNDRSNFNLFY
jgi:hypothetical protein